MLFVIWYFIQNCKPKSILILWTIKEIKEKCYRCAELVIANDDVKFGRIHIVVKSCAFIYTKMTEGEQFWYPWTKIMSFWCRYDSWQLFQGFLFAGNEYHVPLFEGLVKKMDKTIRSELKLFVRRLQVKVVNLLSYIYI